MKFLSAITLLAMFSSGRLRSKLHQPNFFLPKIICGTITAVLNKPMEVIFNFCTAKFLKWVGEIKDAKLPTFAYFKHTPY